MPINSTRKRKTTAKKSTTTKKITPKKSTTTKRKTKSTRKNYFGALDVPAGMRPVSDFRRTDRPFTIMPFGPAGRWLEQGPQGAASTMANSFGGYPNHFAGYPNSFGRYPNHFGGYPNRFGGYPNRFGGYPNRYGSSLEGRMVNPSGYLSTWYGQPRIVPTSWNPLLLQGHNTFREGINSPMLSNVVSHSNGFGRYHPITPRQMTSHHGFGKRRGSRIVNNNATTSKGWKNTSKKLDRSDLPRSCFLGRGIKFPICNADEQFDCKGILAALQRSKKGSKVHKAARAKGKKLGCAWV
jgi:hypothetical protein